MSTASRSMPRIFVSHSHTDNGYCREFMAELRQALGSEDTVWYDEHNLGWGNIRRTIEFELEHRQHFIAILSPAAVESPWVNDEIDAALGLLREGKMRTVSFVTAARCDVPRLLRGYKRVEVAEGGGCPPPEAAARVLRFVNPQVGMRIAALLPHDRFPERLERLGFVAEIRTDPTTGKEAAFLSPPLCPVPAGPFRMGRPRWDTLMGQNRVEAYTWETPQITVDLPAYQIAMFPVTVA